jgi:hypothetical protein
MAGGIQSRRFIFRKIMTNLQIQLSWDSETSLCESPHSIDSRRVSSHVKVPDHDRPRLLPSKFNSPAAAEGRALPTDARQAEPRVAGDLNSSTRGLSRRRAMRFGLASLVCNRLVRF